MSENNNNNKNPGTKTEQFDKIERAAQEAAFLTTATETAGTETNLPQQQDNALHQQQQDDALRQHQQDDVLHQQQQDDAVSSNNS